MKKLNKILMILLFIWFTLDITGFKIGSFVLVESPGLMSFDFFWWILLCVCLFLYHKKQALYLISFLVMWLFVQFSSHWYYTLFGASEKKLAGYNNYFSNTHHIFGMSETTLIPDTYHIVLHLLIIGALVTVIMNKMKNDPLK
jgi:hypothetical protein